MLLRIRSVSRDSFVEENKERFYGLYYLKIKATWNNVVCDDAVQSLADFRCLYQHARIYPDEICNLVLKDCNGSRVVVRQPITFENK